jgi:signal transduction histidine kinase/predicted CoA-binding protein
MREVLAKVPLLADLSPADLDHLAGVVKAETADAGKVLFEEGDAGDRAYVIVAGELEILKQSEGREVLLAVRRSGEVIGEMSLIEDAPRMASVRARVQTKLLAIERGDLDRLLDESTTAARAMLHNVLARWRSTSARVRQSERMAQLGTLTAGIAHELNNPAAAVRRGSSQVDEFFSAYAAAQRAIGARDLSGHPKLAALTELANGRTARPSEDPVDRSDREADLEDALDDLEADDPGALAPALTEAGFDADMLEDELGDLDPQDALTIVDAVARTQAIRSVLLEIGEGAARISEIVKALKTHSFLDQAPVLSVDVHEGIDSALIILKAKLAGLHVRRQYADDLPHIQAYGSELNQVWTNLLDNAADAIRSDESREEPGNILITTRHSGDYVEVSIEDDGPGIPQDIQNKIFDAFFTTKEPGKGTGLGLDISYNVIVSRHRGDLRVTSRPGKTRFRITLPVDFGEHTTSRPSLESDRTSDEALLSILKATRTIAVVGAHDRPGIPAHDVPAAAVAAGYDVWPVNPTIQSAFGHDAVRDLKSLSATPDVVLIFRRAEHVPTIVEDAIAIGAKVVWMQPGIVHETAAARAVEAGLAVIMDRCWRQTMVRLGIAADDIEEPDDC